MILNVSGRTDIVAFYTPWFMKRMKEGFLDVRNPFHPKLISRIDFADVDAILFCTKNPLPIIPHLKEIKKPVLFHITLTGYKSDIEPSVIDKSKIIEGIKTISTLLGKDSVVIRYDPVFLSDKYSLAYHCLAFERICQLLDGYVSKILISFLDIYKNVEKNKNILQYRNFSETDDKGIGMSFSASAKAHHMSVHTCFEKRNLYEYGFDIDECMSANLAYQLTGKTYQSEWKARKERNCHCVAMVDVGEYNTCPHLCRYCYANFNEKTVMDHFALHDPDSSLLIGHLDKDDVIKERKK